jgi:hypothetical protein
LAENAEEPLIRGLIRKKALTLKERSTDEKQLSAFPQHKHPPKLP